MESIKFWFFKKDSKTSKINFENILLQSDLMGFKIYENNLVQIVNNEIYFRDEKYFYDSLKLLIKEKNEINEAIVKDRFERDMLSQGKKLTTRLKDIDKSLILVDDRNSAYKFFQNGYLKITSDSIRHIEYEYLNNYLIWSHKKVDREWKGNLGSTLYADFIENSIGLSDYTKLVLGYLCHDFNEEGKGYLIVLTDQTQSSKDGGGTGKNVLSSLLKHNVSTIEVSAEQLKYDSSIMQSWKFQRIFIISDAGSKFNWLFLKNLITGNTQLKRLYQNEEQIAYENMPKFIVSTNFSVPDNDGGLNRRIRILEFSSFYKREGGVDIYHGGMFPNIWDDSDWTGYDAFIAECIQLYFITDGIIEEVSISESGNIKMFIGNYGEDLYDFIDTNFDNWLEKGMFTTQEFNLETNKFLIQKNNQKDFSNAKLNNAIESFVILKNEKEAKFKYSYNKNKKISNIRYRIFEKIQMDEVVIDINTLSSN